MVYRYRSINEKQIESLRARQIFFSNVTEFNDPFDSQVNAIYAGTEQEWINYLERLGLSLAEINRKIWALKHVNKQRGERRGILVYDRYQDFQEGAYVCCFSQKPDIILMWGHYADSHKGMVLGFNTVGKESVKYIEIEPNQIKIENLEDNRLLPLMDIEYSADLPTPGHGLKEHNYVKRFMKTKFADWAYEQEVRAFLNRNWFQGSSITYSENSLGLVLFGMKTERDKMKGVIEAVLDSGSKNVKFAKCEKDAFRFAVNVKEIAPKTILTS